MTLYSYVVDHDEGYAPNPTPPFCTLVHCKFAKGARRNIVESAEVGDWIVGTGGASRRSSGTGSLIYIMQVTEKLAFDAFIVDKRFAGRIDHHRPTDGLPRRYALISTRYAYFGARAPSLKRLGIDPRRIVKIGPGYRNPGDAMLPALLKRIALDGRIGMPCMSRRTSPDLQSDRARKTTSFDGESRKPTCRETRRCSCVPRLVRRPRSTSPC